MAKPYIHSLSSVKRWGGTTDDYIDIHNFMDSSKGAIPDNRHRALTHNSWFLSVVLERVFGITITNSDGRVISVRDIGEQHVLEDFANRFIPSAQDYLQEIEWKDWMNNGLGTPPSNAKLAERKKKLSMGQTMMDAAGKREREIDDSFLKQVKDMTLGDFVIDRKEDRD